MAPDWDPELDLVVGLDGVELDGGGRRRVLGCRLGAPAPRDEGPADEHGGDDADRGDDVALRR